MTDAAPQYKRLHGWGLIPVVALVLLGTFEYSLVLFDQPGARGHFGFNGDVSAPTVITVVIPGQAAERAGVRIGDRIDLDRLYSKRTTTYDPVIHYQRPPGARVEIPFIRGTNRLTIAITMGSAMGEPPYYHYAEYFNNIISIMLLLLAAWIVIRRPTLMTWSLFLFCLGSSQSFVLSRFGYGAVLGNSLVSALLFTGPFLIVFASRVPNDVSSAWRRWFASVAIALFVAGSLAGLYPSYGLYSVVAWSVFGLSSQYVFPPWWVSIAIYDATWTLVLIAVLVSYAVARGQDRERMRWVALGVTMIAASNVPSSVPALFGHGIPYLESSLAEIVGAMGLVAIAYGIVKGRIVDVTFVLSHAIVAAVLAGLIVAAFAIADWAVSKVLASARLGTLADIGLAIVLAFSFSGLHRRVDRVVDRVFFRKRYNAERRLKLAARSVLRSTSADAVREFLIDEPQAALDLSSAALFEPSTSSSWKRTRAIGWTRGMREELEDNDALVRRVASEQASSKISSMQWTAASLPTGLAHPVLAVPVLARGRVLAIAFYGQHHSGADIDPEEIAEIERVADEAGAAFDHVEAENLRRENEAQAHRIEELMQQLSPRVSGP